MNCCGLEEESSVWDRRMVDYIVASDVTDIDVWNYIEFEELGYCTVTNL